MEVVIDKLCVFVFPNYYNFASDLKHLFYSGLCMIDNITALKDHFGFEYIHNIRLSWQQYKVFVFKNFIGFSTISCGSCYAYVGGRRYEIFMYNV